MGILWSTLENSNLETELEEEKVNYLSFRSTLMPAIGVRWFICLSSLNLPKQWSGEHCFLYRHGRMKAQGAQWGCMCGLSLVDRAPGVTRLRGRFAQCGDLAWAPLWPGSVTGWGGLWKTAVGFSNYWNYIKTECKIKLKIGQWI